MIRLSRSVALAQHRVALSSAADGHKELLAARPVGLLLTAVTLDELLACSASVLLQHLQLELIGVAC